MADGPAFVFRLAGSTAWMLPQISHSGQPAVWLSKRAAEIRSPVERHHSRFWQRDHNRRDPVPQPFAVISEVTFPSEMKWRDSLRSFWLLYHAWAGVVSQANRVS